MLLYVALLLILAAVDRAQSLESKREQSRSLPSHSCVSFDCSDATCSASMLQFAHVVGNRVEFMSGHFRSSENAARSGQFTWLPTWSNENFNGADTDSRTYSCMGPITKLRWRHQNWYGLIDLEVYCSNGGTHRFTNNNHGFWDDMAACTSGFDSLTGREQSGYGIINVKSSCIGSSIETSSNENMQGHWNVRMDCPDNAVVPGVRVREQSGYGIVNFNLECMQLTPSPTPSPTTEPTPVVTFSPTASATFEPTPVPPTLAPTTPAPTPVEGCDEYTDGNCSLSDCFTWRGKTTCDSTTSFQCKCANYPNECAIRSGLFPFRFAKTCQANPKVGKISNGTGGSWPYVARIGN